MRRLVLPVSFVAIHATAHAQQWVKDPIVRICENITSCDDEKHIDLSQKELAFVEALLNGIPAKASGDQVKRYFGKPALNSTEPVALGLGNGKARATAPLGAPTRLAAQLSIHMLTSIFSTTRPSW